MYSQLSSCAHVGNTNSSSIPFLLLTLAFCLRIRIGVSLRNKRTIQWNTYHKRLFLLSMTIGYLHVGVILLTSRILLLQSVVPLWLNPGQTVEFYFVNKIYKSHSCKEHEMSTVVALCKERFSMNSLFASNIIYSFQIFALTLFLVIHTEFA